MTTKNGVSGIKQLMRIIVPIVLITTILIGGIGFAEAKRIMPGTYVLGINLSYLNKEQALEKINQLEKQLNQKTVTIICNDKTHTTTYEELGLAINANDTVDKALNLKGALDYLRSHITSKHHEIALVLALDSLLIENLANMLADEMVSDPVNASFHISEDGQVIIIPHVNGTKIDLSSLEQDLLRAVVQPNPQVILKAIIIEPDVKTQDIESYGINGLISNYTTRFTNDINRTHNIKVAANILNGLIIPPGAVISFNEVIGARTTEKGYRPAGVIIGDRLTEGIGGGICQVSSTLYNAALVANMGIIERHSHSLAVPYVPLGLDAAVAYGILDLKLKNNLDTHLYITAQVINSQLTVKIFGDTLTKSQVQVNSWVTEKIDFNTEYVYDPTLNPEEKKVEHKGMPGYRTKAARIITSNGVTKTETLPGSYYFAVDEIVHHGMLPEKAEEI